MSQRYGLGLPAGEPACSLLTTVSPSALGKNVRMMSVGSRDLREVSSVEEL